MNRMLLCAMALLTVAGTSHAAPSPQAAPADNALTFDLLREAAKGTDNVVFSPFSVWTTLAMTSAGAEKETLKQMREVLHLPEDDAAAHALAGGWAGLAAEQRSPPSGQAHHLHVPADFLHAPASR